MGREHIGDAVNSTGYLQAICAALPDSQITVEFGQGTLELLQGFPNLSAIWGRATHEGFIGKWRRIDRMAKERFDATIILDDSRRFAVEAWLAGIPFRAGVLRKGPSKVLNVAVMWSRQKHDLFHPLDGLMRKLGIPMKGFGPKLFPSPTHTDEAAGHLSKLHGRPIVVLNPSSLRSYNQWVQDRWREVADALTKEGYGIVIVGHPDHKEINRKAFEGGSGVRLDLTGAFGLLTLHEVIRLSKYLISVDTGTVHIGVAARTPTVVLYGPTDPDRFHPWGDRWEKVRAEDCRMDSIETDAVLSAFEALRVRFP